MSLKNSYKTVLEESQTLLIEKKSKFISHVKPVDNEEDALKYLAEMRSKYSDAKHNVYAYVIDENNIFRYSDDGEPSGTAGMPVLDTIRKEGLVDVIVVVTRYFGGVLLGTGGLVRAYTEAAKQGLKAAEIMELKKTKKIVFEFSYELKDKILFYLKKEEYEDKEIFYGENVRIMINIPENEEESFVAKLIEITESKIYFID